MSKLPYKFGIALSDAQLRSFRDSGEIIVEGFVLTTEDIHVISSSSPVVDFFFDFESV